MEAFITLDCGNCLQNTAELLKGFQRIGWEIHNAQGEIEFLPLGDKDEYNWQCEKMSEKQFYDIVFEKISCKEMIGVNLFYRDGKEGISLLAYNTNQITLDISINRRIISGKHTDMIWYLKNIIYKFFDEGISVISYKLEEFED